MNKENTRDYEQDLKALEFRVDELIQLCLQLKTENQTLREQKASLLEKNEQARSKIEKMIMRLKAMEQD